MFARSRTRRPRAKCRSGQNGGYRRPSILKQSPTKSPPPRMSGPRFFSRAVRRLGAGVSQIRALHQWRAIPPEHVPGSICIAPDANASTLPARAGCTRPWAIVRQPSSKARFRDWSIRNYSKKVRALAMRFPRHDGIYRSDVSFLLFTPGACPAFRSGRCQGIGHAGKNMTCPSSAMSSGRLFLDRVGRHQSPSPLHRHHQNKPMAFQRVSDYHRTRKSVLTLCVSRGDKRT